MRTQRGFTLVEVIVAITIFAIISVICYDTLHRVLTDQKKLQTEQQQWSALALTLHTLDDDFSFARARTVRDIDGETLPAFLGQPTDPRAVAAPTVEFTRGGLWVLASGTKPGIARIDYRLKNHDLLREIWPHLDRAPEDTPVATRLLAHVKKFEVHFLDTGGNWVDHWPESSTAGGSSTNTASEPLPRAVKVTLQTDFAGTITRILEVGQ